MWCKNWDNTGFCQHGCTGRNWACHRFGRYKPCKRIPCLYVHVCRGYNADGDWVGYQQQARDQQARGSSSAGARSRSQSPLSSTRTGYRTTTPKLMPQPRDQQARGSSSAAARSRSPPPPELTRETIEALNLLGLDEKEVGADPTLIYQNYGKALLNRCQDIMDAKQHLEHVYRKYGTGQSS